MIRSLQQSVSDYLAVLTTMQEELRHANPSRTVVESCHRFLTENQAPIDNTVIRPQVPQWRK